MDVSRRTQLRDRLVRWARADSRVGGAAFTGSTAAGTADAWSDIDMFWGVLDVDPSAVLADLSDHLYADAQALHHFDLVAGAATYRAFLLPGPLEVDLGVAPMKDFRSFGGAPFDVVFGAAQPPSGAGAPNVDHVAGLLWHHVLHARSSIARHRPWQAEHWISAARDQLLVLTAHRHGLPTAYAKGADALPSAVTRPLEPALVRGLDVAELARALQVVARAAVRELSRHDEALAARLEGALSELSGAPPTR